MNLLRCTCVWLDRSMTSSTGGLTGSPPEVSSGARLCQPQAGQVQASTSCPRERNKRKEGRKRWIWILVKGFNFKHLLFTPLFLSITGQLNKNKLSLQTMKIKNRSLFYFSCSLFLSHMPLLILPWAPLVPFIPGDLSNTAFTGFCILFILIGV